MIDSLSRHEPGTDGHFSVTLRTLTSLSKQEPHQAAKLRASADWFLGEIDTVSVDRIFEYIKRKSASVEVKMGGDCFRLPFRIPDVCLALQAHPKFMTDCGEKLQDIPRDNPEQKVLALVNNMRVILREMHHVGKILKHPWLWPLASVKLQDIPRDNP